MHNISEESNTRVNILNKLMTEEDVSTAKVLSQILPRPPIEPKEVMVLDHSDWQAKIVDAL